MISKPFDAPLVSVLMCANKADAYLEIALESVFDQLYTNFEVILVANGVGKSDIAAKYSDYSPRLRVVESDFFGLTNNLNIGLYHCRGELVARMDSDDVALPERLIKQVEMFQLNPSLVVLGSSYTKIDKTGKAIGVVSPPKTDRAIRSALKYRNALCHPSVMFRRSAVLRAGGYLSGVYAEDYDLWVRMADDPANIFGNCSVPLIQYRIWQTAARGAPGAYATSLYACVGAFARGNGFGYIVGAALFGVRWLLSLLTRRSVS